MTQEADAFFAFGTPVRSPAYLRQIEHAAILQCNSSGCSIGNKEGLYL